MKLRFGGRYAEVPFAGADAIICEMSKENGETSAMSELQSSEFC
ncbi:MAG: hypothetical protein Q4A40_05515 [Bacillota bacterium]|nr:hypothetical protein [Bacillota bacterium]